MFSLSGTADGAVTISPDVYVQSLLLVIFNEARSQRPMMLARHALLMNVSVVVPSLHLMIRLTRSLS